MIPAYGKVQALGGRVLLDGIEVVIEEKVDGSQFSFGMLETAPGEYAPGARSKNQQIDLDAPPAMFLAACQTVLAKADELTPGFIYRGEAFSKPKHNAIAYDRVPKGNVLIFDIELPDGRLLPYHLKHAEALRLGLETVPHLHTGVFDFDTTFIEKLLDRESVLGGAKIEGIVIKPVIDQFITYGGQEMRLRAKFVSEGFKELNAKNWKDENKGPLQKVFAAVRSEARWRKAVQSLRDQGSLEESVKDIGPLIGVLSRDIDSESGPIADMLYTEFKKQIIREAARGFPEWYKMNLLTEGLAEAGIRPRIVEGAVILTADIVFADEVGEVTQDAVDELILRAMSEPDAAQGDGDEERRADLSSVR